MRLPEAAMLSRTNILFSLVIQRVPYGVSNSRVTYEHVRII